MTGRHTSRFAIALGNDDTLFRGGLFIAGNGTDEGTFLLLAEAIRGDVLHLFLQVVESGLDLVGRFLEGTGIFDVAHGGDAGHTEINEIISDTDVDGLGNHPQVFAVERVLVTARGDGGDTSSQSHTVLDGVLLTKHDAQDLGTNSTGKDMAHGSSLFLDDVVGSSGVDGSGGGGVGLSHGKYLLC